MKQSLTSLALIVAMASPAYALAMVEDNSEPQQFDYAGLPLTTNELTDNQINATPVEGQYDYSGVQIVELPEQDNNEQEAEPEFRYIY